MEKLLMEFLKIFLFSKPHLKIFENICHVWYIRFLYFLEKMPTLDFDIGMIERIGQELHPNSGHLADTEVTIYLLFVL